MNCSRQQHASKPGGGTDTFGSEYWQVPKEKQMKTATSFKMNFHSSQPQTADTQNCNGS